MLDALQQEQLNQDLGLGGRMSERSHSRLLNHDGTFNVRRSTLGPFHPYNAYHTLLSMPLPRLLALVIVHPITDASPLRGFTEEAFRASDPELVCLVSGHDETFAQTVHAKISYDSSEIVWGGRFRGMYFGDTERVSIDLDRLHLFESVDPPAVV